MAASTVHDSIELAIRDVLRQMEREVTKAQMRNRGQNPHEDNSETIKDMIEGKPEPFLPKLLEQRRAMPDILAMEFPLSGLPEPDLIDGGRNKVILARIRESVERPVCRLMRDALREAWKRGVPVDNGTTKEDNQVEDKQDQL